MTTPKKSAKKPAPKKTAKKPPRASEANGSAKPEVLSASELANAKRLLPRGTKFYGILLRASDNSRTIRVVYADPDRESKGNIRHIWPKLWRVLGRWDEKREGGKFGGTGYSAIQEAREELGSLLYGDANAFTNDNAML